MALAQFPPESAYAQERAKWENRPWVNRPYPKMLYMAREHNGKFVLGLPHDENFAATCQTVVQNEFEEQQKIDEGWRVKPHEAIQHQLNLLRMISDAAAERHYSDSKMSPKAQAEAKAADDATEHQLPEVPVARTVKRGPGRPPKNAA